MKSSSVKAKGRRLQNQVRDIIRERFPQLEPDDVKPALMGESGNDIKLSPAARKVFPFSIECKNQESVSIWSWWKQTVKNLDKGTKPLLFFTRNHHETLVTMRMDDFFDLYEASLDKQAK